MGVVFISTSVISPRRCSLTVLRAIDAYHLVIVSWGVDYRLVRSQARTGGCKSRSSFLHICTSQEHITLLTKLFPRDALSIRYATKRRTYPLQIC